LEEKVKSILGVSVFGSFLFLVGASACSSNSTKSAGSDSKSAENTVQQAPPGQNTGGGNAGQTPPDDGIDESKYPAIIRNIPKGPNNPIRSGAIQVKGVWDDPEAARWLFTKVFDLAEALNSEVSKSVQTQLKFIEGRPPDHEVCQIGALATADAAAASVYWCVFTDIFNKPGYALLTAAGGLLHEGLHVKGFVHDRDNKSYGPCEGTSAAGEIFYKMKICKESYCTPFEPELDLQMNHVLDYNFFYVGDIQNDNRLNQGTCLVWKQAFGIQ
jgi:hypothetical protein